MLVPLYLILLAAYATGLRDQRTNEVENSLLVARLVASVIDGYRRDVSGTLLAASLAFGDRARPLDQDSLGPYLDQVARAYPTLRALFVTDPDGVVIASQASAGVGSDVSGRSYIVALRNGAEIVWSGGLAGLQTGQTTIAHARAIRAPDGAVRGFVVAAFQPQALIEQLPVRLAADAELVLVDDNGRLLFESGDNDMDPLADLSSGPLVRRALGGETVRLDGERTPFSSGAQYGAVVPVGNSGWAVAYTRPLDSLEGSLRDRLLQQALAITVVLAAAAALIALLTRRLLRPLRTLVATAGAVARGDRTRVGLSTGDADIMALATAMDDMSRAVAEREEALRDETRVVETLREVGSSLAGELDLEKVVQAATDAGTSVTAAEFGAFFYNLVDEQGESYTLYTLSGAPREAFEGFPMPRNTDVFGPTFRGEGTVRLDDVTQDPRYGRNAPYYGMPHGHLPVRSYLAVPVLSRSGEVLGGMFFGHSRVAVFTARAERLATGIAAQAAVAIDNARLYREAQEAVQARDHFLSIASHELRTPLAAIKATAQAALRAQSRGILDEDRVQRSLQTIATTTDHVARLATDLLDVARLRTGTLPLRSSAVELEPLLQNVISGFRQQWDGTHGLIAGIDARDVVVQGDPDRLQQVFGNLLENAGKYSPPGSQVRVAAIATADGVEVTVSDEGIGLPPGLNEALFEPFGRAANAMERQITGLGLGLYIARQLVLAHGGRIWCVSPGEGQGSTFSVWLPRVPVSDTVAPEHSPVTALD